MGADMPRTPVKSKFTPPALPPLVERRGLFRRLHAGRDRRVVLILGQPAQGKSTLVAAYTAAAGIPTAWLHLDRKAADARTCFNLLGHALTRLSKDSTPLGYPNGSKPAKVSGRKEIRWQERLEPLMACIAAPAAIVLDGIDRLGPQAGALELIATLVAVVPNGVQIHLISRRPPPLKLQRLRIRRQLMTLENADLAFDSEEIRLFFTLQSDIVLNEAQVDRIVQATDGWVGGLVLIAETLGRFAADRRCALIDENLTDLLNQATLAYFAEEVFSGQPRAIQTFLTRTSLLEIVEPEIAARLTGVHDARSVLDDLVACNLFTQVLYAGSRQAGYRYNPLFRNFLQHQFHHTVDPDRRARLLQKAGKIYADREEYRPAVDYLLQAGAFGMATELILQAAVDLTIGGRHEELGRWIASVPDTRRRTDPWLMLWQAVAQRRPGETLALEDLELARVHFQSQDDPRGRCLTLAYLIEAGVFQVVDAARLAPWLEEGEALLKELGHYPYYHYAKALLWVQLGLAHTFSTGDLNKGISACRNAAVLARQIGDHTLELNATLIPVSALAAKGEFQAAEQALACCEGHLRANIYPEYRVLNHLIRMQMMLYRGDLAKAGRSLEKIRIDLENLGLLFLYPLFVESSGLLQVYQGNHAEAGTTARHLMDVAVMTGNRRIEAQALRLRAQVHYFRGAYDCAARDIAQALDLLAGSPHGDFCLFQSLLLQGIVACHRQDHSLCRKALAAAHQEFVRMGAPMAMAESHLAQALVAESRAAHDEVRRHLTEGLGIILEREYRQVMVLRPADLAAACRLAITRGIQSRGEGLQWLLSQMGPALPAAEAPGRPQPKSTAVMISAEAHRSRLPHLSIRTFGGFAVHRQGTTIVDGNEWHGHQPKLLLKSIVAHGGRNVPRDVLIEDLWPNTDADAALRRFKVTLHRLRRTLEPKMNQNFGWAYVHLKDNLVTLDEELCRIDVTAFHQLCRRLRRIEPLGADEKALGLCQQIRDLYRGDFLPEEPYAPWVEVKRALLRDDFVRVLERMVEILERRQDIDTLIEALKAMIQIAPARDDIRRRLMHWYDHRGDHAMALAVYRDFHTFLSVDLDVAPDPETTALYHRLRAISSQDN